MDVWRGRRALRKLVTIVSDNIQLYDEKFQFLSNVTRLLDCCFANYHKFELLTFAKVRQHFEGMVGNIIWVLLEI